MVWQTAAARGEAKAPLRNCAARLPLPLLLLLMLLLLVTPGGSGEAHGAAAGGSCQRLFAGGAAAQWRRIVGPLDGEIVLQQTGQAFEVALAGDVAELPRGAAAVLLLDGALVAYGGGWEAEDALLLPPLGSGAHRISLGVVGDTGGATWKRDSDLCVVQSVSFAVQGEDAAGAHSEPAGAVGAILWPRSFVRLLASEMHLLRFTLREARDISIDCNGERVRDLSPYDAGQHDTTIDFVAECRGRGDRRRDARAGANELTITLVVWDDEPEGSTAERMELEQHELVVKTVDEPPNMLVQFPPDGYVFQDATNVNIAALVPYFAFHRFPHALGGGGGFLQVRVDSLDATSAPVQRDSEGVFELTMSFGPPYTDAGWHSMQLMLLDAQRQPISGHVELQYYVADAHESASQGGAGAAHSAGPGSEADVSDEDEGGLLRLPVGRWALFGSDSGRGASIEGAPPAAQPAPATFGAAEGVAAFGGGGGEGVCSGHGRCISLTGLRQGNDGGAGAQWQGSGPVGVGGAGCGCMCSGDWIGGKCDVDLATAEEFVPDSLPFLDPARRVLSASFVNGSQQLLQRLSRMHVHANCDRERALAFDYNDQVSMCLVPLTTTLCLV
jgi:hypothetical protein